jgi:Sodium/calcium exchanger protein
MSALHEPIGSARTTVRDVVFMVLAIAVALPWLVLRFQGYHGDPATVAALSGLAIVGAAFLLSWAAEAFEKDVSQALALALLALIAVLPEYAVDMVFAWKAASDPSQAGYAVANMTGANRLLIGIGTARRVPEPGVVRIWNRIAPGRLVRLSILDHLTHRADPGEPPTCFVGVARPDRLPG